MLRVLAAVVALTQAEAFLGAPRAGGSRAPLRLGALASAVEAPTEGQRTIVDGPDGAIIVTKLGGEFYATDAKCPHLGLPMKRGKIEDGPNGAELTCNFHNSCWEMKSGKCTRWITGALGVENELFASVMSNVGGKEADIRAYEVTEEADGTLSLA